MTTPNLGFLPLPGLTEDDIRRVVAEELARRDQTAVAVSRRLGKREDALLWAIKFYEGRPAAHESIVTAAKAFEAYVYGGESA